jgi:hypothetical protein
MDIEITADLMTITIYELMYQNTEVITKALESNKNTNMFL